MLFLLQASKGIFPISMVTKPQAAMVSGDRQHLADHHMRGITIEARGVSSRPEDASRYPARKNRKKIEQNTEALDKGDQTPRKGNNVIKIKQAEPTPTCKKLILPRHQATKMSAAFKQFVDITVYSRRSHSPRVSANPGVKVATSKSRPVYCCKMTRYPSPKSLLSQMVFP